MIPLIRNFSTIAHPIASSRGPVGRRYALITDPLKSRRLPLILSVRPPPETGAAFLLRIINRHLQAQSSSVDTFAVWYSHER